MPDPQIQPPIIKPLVPLARLSNPPVVNITVMKKDYRHVVVFGRGGEGKTDFGLRGTPRPIEWIDADRRANTIAEKFNDGRIWHIYQPSTQQEIENSIAHAIYNLQQHYQETKVKGTILLDSYTAAKNTITIDYLQRQGRPVDSKMSIEDRSAIKKVMLTIINNLKYCEFNLVVTAEQGVQIIGEENKDTGKSKIAGVVGGVPKNEDDLMYFCDYLLHLYPEEVKVDGTNQFVTRHYWKLYKSSTSRIPQEFKLQIAPKEDIDWAGMCAELDGLQRAEIKKMRGELKV